MHDLALNLLRNCVPPNAQILVVGAGTGQEVLAYAKANPTWQITGVDPTEKMLAVAAGRVQEQGLGNRIQLSLGQVKDLPPAPCFAAATSILVMQFIPDDGRKQEYLTEIASRLNSGKKVILIDLVGDKRSKEFDMFLSAWQSRQLRMGEGKEEVTKDFVHIGRDVQFITESRVHELLKAVGFRGIHKFFQSYLFSGWIAERS